jgi:hypothetical protein
MADFFSGLLGIGDEQDPMAAAQRAGMLGVASGLLGAGGPSLMPTSLGAALGSSIMGGRQVAQQSLSDSMQRLQQQQKMREQQELKAALPGIFVDGKPDYAKLQQLVVQFPEMGGKIADALQKSAGPETIQVDVGNEVQIRTKQGDIVARIPKGAAPQAAQRETFSLSPEFGVMVGSLGTIRPATLPDGTTLAPKGKISMQTLYDDEGKEFKALVDEKTGKFTPVGGAKSPNLQYDAPSGTVFNPQGGRVTPARDAEGNIITPPEPKLTETQGSAAGYLFRMNQAESILSGPIDPTDPTSKSREELGLYPGVTSKVVEAIPGVGPRVSGAVQGTEVQKYRQAQEDWVRAKLRKESGAVIGKEEMDQEIKTYFPQPGDKQGTIEQKRQSRLNAQRQMEIMSGPAGAKAAGLRPQQQNQTQNQTQTQTQPKRFIYNRAKNTIEEQ